MDTVMDRARAANPAHAAEFAHRADFAALVLPRRRRGRRGLLAVPVAAIAAGLALVPSTPQASEIIRALNERLDASDGQVLYAQLSVAQRTAAGDVTDYGTRREWVRQAPGDATPSMRSLQVIGTADGPAGSETVSKPGYAQMYTPGKPLRTEPGVQMVPGEVFRAGALLKHAQAGGV